MTVMAGTRIDYYELLGRIRTVGRIQLAIGALIILAMVAARLS